MTITLKLDILGYRIAKIDVDITEGQPWVITKPVGTFLNPERDIIKSVVVTERKLAERWAKWVSRKWVEKMVS